MDKELFGQRIKNLRRLHHLTQEKLAELIDIDIRQVARIEAGENYPSVVSLIKICQVFNVTPNDLIYDNKNVDENANMYKLKSDIFDILSLAKTEQLELIKKLILAVF